MDRMVDQARNSEEDGLLKSWKQAISELYDPSGFRLFGSV